MGSPHIQVGFAGGLRRRSLATRIAGACGGFLTALSLSRGAWWWALVVLAMMAVDALLEDQRIKSERRLALEHGIEAVTELAGALGKEVVVSKEPENG